MASRKIALPRDTISLSADMTDKLLSKGSGDAALLYLYLLRHDGYYEPEEACRTMKWERTRLDGAMLLLSELGIQTGEVVPSFTEAVPKKEHAPEYTNEDVANALQDSTSEFPMLLEEVERLLNRQLPPLDLRRLLEAYDHLSMPAEVLVMLVSMKCQEYEEKYGKSRRPRSISSIVTTAYRWKEAGIDTLEAATAYLQKKEYYRSREGELLNALSIRGRQATSTERTYLSRWAEWGFTAEAVALAYDRTVTNTGKMNWGYCNAILQRWHKENRHTLEEVQAASPTPAKRASHSRNALQVAQTPTPQEEAEQARRIEENQRWMREFLQSPGADQQ